MSGSGDDGLGAFLPHEKPTISNPEQMEAPRDRSSSSSDVEEIFPADSVSNIAPTAVDEEDDSIKSRIAKFGVLPAGHNPRVSCLVLSCKWAGMHKARLVDHWKKAHSNMPELVRLLAELGTKSHNTTGKTKVKTSHASKTSQGSTPGVPLFSSTTTTTTTSSPGQELVRSSETKRARRGIDDQLGAGVCEALTRAKARLQIRIGAPFCLHEWPAVDDFVDEVVRIGRQYPQCFVSKSSAQYSFKRTKVRSEFLDLLSKLFKATEMTLALAQQLYAEYEKPHLTFECLDFGMTLCIDGRSNINHDPMLFSALETAQGFLWQCGTNSGSEKKSAEYMASVIFHFANGTYSDHFARFSPHIFASMQDNTASVVKAGRLVEAEGYVVWLNCTLHMVALISTNIFKRVPYAATLLSQLETLTSFIRNRPRVSTMLKTIIADTESAKSDAQRTKARVLLRIIPTRMLTARACFQRAVLLEEHLSKLFSKTGKLKHYYSELDADGRREFDVAAAIARDNDFFHGAQFMVEVLTPVLQMLRFLDRQSSKSRDVYKLMRFASESVATVLGQAQFESEPSVRDKQIILEVVADMWDRHQCPGHSASWFLNPRERETLVRIALSPDDDDQDEYHRAREDTMHVIETIIRRMGKYEAKLDVDRSIEQASIQLLQYVMDPQSGGFMISAIEALSPERWWAAQGNRILCRVARITQVWPAGTGNLERSMKINALVHSKTRNSLTLENADILVRGYVAQVAVDLDPIWNDEKIADFWSRFAHLSEKEEADLGRWQTLLAKHTRTVVTTIMSGEARLDDQTAMPPTASTDASESDEENPPGELELLGDDEEEEEAEEEPRRSKRSPGLSEKFRRAVANLKD